MAEGIRDRIEVAVSGGGSRPPPKRSSGALKRRRVPLSWPKDREFRILAIDGGGIRGVFPAAFLAALESRHLGGCSVARYFDLIAGTSTGGIIALGLGARLGADEIRDLYVRRGCEVFPPVGDGVLGRIQRRWRDSRQLFTYRYDRDALERVLSECFGSTKFGDARTRLCIPSVDGRYGETYIFKTPHHPDFTKDAADRMTKVAMATAAAPTFFRPYEDAGYTFVDGGLYANNPIMVALADTLSCFSVPRERIRILSLGCGVGEFVVDRERKRGGAIAWRRVIDAAMQLQSLDARGQAGLLIGAEHILRIEPHVAGEAIELDDWKRAVRELVPAAENATNELGETVAEMFLTDEAEPYEPCRADAGSRRRTDSASSVDVVGGMELAI